MHIFLPDGNFRSSVNLYSILFNFFIPMAQVRVLDTYPREDGKCLCWVQETKGRHCSGCESVATQWFNVSGE